MGRLIKMSGRPVPHGVVSYPLYILPRKENGDSILWDITLNRPAEDMWDFHTMPAVTGVTREVHNQTEWDSAVNNANYGDEIVVDAGLVLTEQFIVPNKTWTSGWITVRVANAATTLPVGVRVRPSDAADMFTLRSTQVNGRALQPAPSSSHWRFIGVIFTNESGVDFADTLVNFHPSAAGWSSKTTAPHDYVFDRCRFKAAPNALQDTRRGFAPGGYNIAAKDCWFDGFADVNTDSQAIGGLCWLSRFHAYNCYFQADDEDILLGGVNPTALDGSLVDTIVQDIIIDKCEFAKATRIYRNKNQFEIKWGERGVLCSCVIHGNRINAQNGIFNIQTNNSDGAIFRDHVRTQHWTIRSNEFFDNEGVLIGIARDNGTDVALGTRFIDFSYNLSHDNVSSDTSGRAYQAIDSEVTPDCAFYNNTIVDHKNSGYCLWSAGSGGTYLPLFGVRVYNNIFSYTTTYGYFAPDMDTIFGTGNWRLDHNMALQAPPAEFNGGTPDNTGTNITVANVAAIGYTDFANKIFSLSASSPGKNAGSDGRDIGCNWETLQANIAGVLTS